MMKHSEHTKPMHSISIAIATYNGGLFLREQLDSLYNQTRLADEIVVSDDGSTDNTLDILEEYHQRYGLTYSINSGRHGVNANFFRAISQCTGDFIQICDQDDIWLPNKLEVHEKAILDLPQDRPAIVSSWVDHIDANGQLMAPSESISDTDHWQDTLMSTERGQGCTMMFNRCLANMVLEKYNTSQLADSVCYDVLIGFTAAIFGIKRNLGIPLMHYRHHGNNVVDKNGPVSLSFWQKVKNMQVFYPFLPTYRFYELDVIYTLYQEQPMPNEIHTYLKQTSIVYHSNYVKGLRILLHMQALPISTKIKILLLSPIAQTLKIIEQQINQ